MADRALPDDRDVAQRRLVVVDDVHATQEGLHRQSRREPGRTRCRQNVIRSRAIVSEADRREVADEDRAGVVHAIGDLRGVARLDLEVLGRVGVDNGKTGLDVVDEHDT